MRWSLGGGSVTAAEEDVSYWNADFADDADGGMREGGVGEKVESDGDRTVGGVFERHDAVLRCCLRCKLGFDEAEDGLDGGIGDKSGWSKREFEGGLGILELLCFF